MENSEEQQAQEGSPGLSINAPEPYQTSKNRKIPPVSRRAVHLVLWLRGHVLGAALGGLPRQDWVDGTARRRMGGFSRRFCLGSALGPLEGIYVDVRFAIFSSTHLHMLCKVLQLLALSIGEHGALRGDGAGEGAVERREVACGHWTAESGLLFRMQGSLCDCKLQGSRSIPASHKPGFPAKVAHMSLITGYLDLTILTLMDFKVKIFCFSVLGSIARKGNWLRT